MDKDTVYLIDNIHSKYNHKKEFDPKLLYSELNDYGILFKTDILLYEKVRELFRSMQLNFKNIDTKEWNPFGDIVCEGSTILIKPNLVIHRNLSFFGSMKSVVTNISVLRPIIDYSLKAVGSRGKVIVADAPVQDCDFKKLITITGLEKMINEYKKVYKNLELIDLRKNQNSAIETVEVDIKDKSMFSSEKIKNKHYSITNYSEEMIQENHSNGMHKYVTSKIVLSADLIINVFKPKAHRIAGLTAAQKNLIGIISKKECLPHYSRGAIAEGGDEFPINSVYRTWFTNLLKNKNKLLWPFKNFVKLFNQLIPEKSIVNGCWYLNDTIWRTISDVNYVINYADKKGTIKNQQQRKVLNVGDMIVCGEKNGPLHPNDKYVGCLVGGFNRNNVDNVVCEMMGFQKKYIRYLLENDNFEKILNGNKVRVITNYKFKPADGWKILKK